LGQLANGLWVITDGLKFGDKVIVDGLQKIQPGAKVKPVPAGVKPAQTRPSAPPAAGGGASAR
jgi:membrane fusion protein (multidrug efflux system)